MQDFGSGDGSSNLPGGIKINEFFQFEAVSPSPEETESRYNIIYV